MEETATAGRDRPGVEIRHSLARLGASRGVNPDRVVAAFLDDPAEFRAICGMPNRHAAGRELVRRAAIFIRLRRQGP